MTEDELSTLLRLLEATHALDPSSPQFLAVERAAAHLEKSAKKKRRLQRSRASRARDIATIEKLGLPRSRAGQTTGAVPEEELERARNCYVCKRPFRQLHPWYPWLCRECGDTSEAFKRMPLPVEGRRILLTGGRVKIGLATALRLLRAGAHVEITTRFPRAAERTYRQQPNAEAWLPRLTVRELDFRDLGRLMGAVEEWSQGPSFDTIINNAAQSVWHPPEHFAALRAGETAASSANLAVPFFTGTLAQLDAQRADSWVQRLGEIRPVDMVEAQVVNAIAPFLIVNGLRENLKRSPFPDRYVVNVSAVEGQFAKDNKAAAHPHTNMAKAGLNMMTRTSAADLREDSIYMVSVDPGWMSREGRNVPPDVATPLEADDCAVRVLHPLASGLAGLPLWGVLLKDFREVPW